MESTRTEYAVPFVLALKKDTIVQYLIDYGKLDAITVSERYLPPRMDERVDVMEHAQIFSTLGSKSGYP